MRTTISLPANLWQLETLAVAMRTTRSELCMIALQRFLQDLKRPRRLTEP